MSESTPQSSGGGARILNGHIVRPSGVKDKGTRDKKHNKDKGDKGKNEKRKSAGGVDDNKQIEKLLLLERELREVLAMGFLDQSLLEALAMLATMLSTATT